MLFSSSSNNLVNNSLKKYIYESTNKYIQSKYFVKNDKVKVIEFIKTPIKCDLCYLNEHKLSDSETIFFKKKFSKFLNYTNFLNPDEKKDNCLQFYLYFLTTSLFFLFDF